MWEDIKGMLGKIISFIFWVIILSFWFGYTLGNYYGMKASYDTPKTFQISIIPGYFIMRVEDPEMRKFKSSRE